LFCGVGLEAKLCPRSCTLGFIKTYRFINGGKHVEWLHDTPCEDIPSSFSEFRGRLLCGVGHILRVYELGQKKLLRKQENKNFSSPITNIQVEESGRVFATDVKESVHVLKYKPEEAQLYIFADDVLKRFVTNFCLLDNDTMAGVDKFENMFVNRLPAGCEDDAEDDPTATKFKWENGYLNGAAFKMDAIAQFYMGEVGTQITKACLNSHGGQEMVLTSTTMGGLNAFVPFEAREDVEFFSHLEMYLRIEA
jgi:splicing factor 3B subunit 3